MKAIIYLLFFIFLSSCANHIGNISSTTIPKNVVFEDMAFGVAQSNKIFGLGGLSKDALVLEAKLNLLNSRPLKTNEEYINFTLDFKKSRIFFFSQNKVTMSADVISYSNTTVKDPFSEKYKSIITSKNKIEGFYNIGDSVINEYEIRGKIISSEGKKKVRLLYKDSNENLKSKKEKLKNLFVTKNEINGFNLNDTIFFNASQTDGVIPRSAIILGFGNEQLLIKLTNSEKSVIKYSEILPKEYLKK